MDSSDLDHGDAYRVTIEKGEQYWLVHVQGVGVTQARSPAEIDLMARDLVACMTDKEPASIRLTWPMSVRVEHWEHGWELHVGDIGVTQSPTLGEAEQHVRDYLVTSLDVDLHVDLTWDLTAAEQAASTSPALAEEVDDFTDNLAGTQRAH